MCCCVFIVWSHRGTSLLFLSHQWDTLENTQTKTCYQLYNDPDPHNPHHPPPPYIRMPPYAHAHSLGTAYKGIPCAGRHTPSPDVSCQRGSSPVTERNNWVCFGSAFFCLSKRPLGAASLHRVVSALSHCLCAIFAIVRFCCHGDAPLCLTLHFRPVFPEIQPSLLIG